MTILAIETSNKTLSVALLRNGKLISEKTIPQILQHSVFLGPVVEEVLKQANVSIQELTSIVVSNGPGSYTGLRIGVTFAKTLAYTLKIPIIPLSSLNVLANSVCNNDLLQSEYNQKAFKQLTKINNKKIENKQYTVLSFFDARRNNVFAGVYKGDTAIIDDAHISMELCLNNIIKNNIAIDIFASPDIDKFEYDILKLFPKACCFNVIPLASTLGQLSIGKEKSNTHMLLPYYLKMTEAEENWLSSIHTKADHSLSKWVDRGAF